jgi:putative ABC transport system permease protein
MFKNYFKIAIRNIIRHKVYSTLNIAGLAIGMACSILILLWVQHERSYDRFHTNAGQLYRLTSYFDDFKAAVSPAGMGEGLQAQLPEVSSKKSGVFMSTPIS